MNKNKKAKQLNKNWYSWATRQDHTEMETLCNRRYLVFQLEYVKIFLTMLY